MARRAAAALLAAVEMGNKTVAPYREETFSLQLVNAWEVLLKARIVQQHGNRLDSILLEKPEDGNVGDEPTRTITFVKALNNVALSQNVRSNLMGINAMRNEVAHLGTLSTGFRETVLRYGSASVVNFGRLYQQWFGEAIQIPYLLPVAFVGKAQVIAPKKSDVRQRQLLNYLTNLTRSTDPADTSYAVSLRLDVSLNPMTGGGGNIGFTNDPNAPLINVSDNQIISAFPWTYEDLTVKCRDRYANFKTNQDFHEVMKQVKKDPNCAFERKLDPTRTGGPRQWRYKPQPTLELLDARYTRLP